MENVRQQQTRDIKQQLIAINSGEMGVQTDSAKPIVTTGDAETEAGVINVNRDTQAGVNTVNRDTQTINDRVTQTRQASEKVKQECEMDVNDRRYDYIAALEEKQHL